MEPGGMYMKHKDWILALLLAVVLPWVLCAFSAAMGEVPQEREETAPTVRETPMLWVLTEGGERKQMALADYLTGVLLGEIPSKFAPEAKKAQAVVARTYALRVAAGDRHQGAVCTLSGCCQKYIDPFTAPAQAVQQAREAVEGTQELVLTYDGKLIDATYFSCSGGMTEDAVAVWGSDIPYLQAVESPGEEYATHYTDRVAFSLEEFQKLLEVTLPQDPKTWFGAVTYTDGGGVAEMVIGGVSYPGTVLRKALGLRSTVFTVQVTEDTVEISTRGYGHRVGMSQYGADAMAASGSSFSEILAHYYRGTKLEQISD